ncbi:glycoside hydrolase family 3 domain protein [Paenibacillus curdlanolyticus YK9]|uniref:beta-glucosidase n=1 Tax=Paenibacillus curdlanolyticus YK9 TaxID=717606 RepID=E0I868_9BACL|nr:beta-glucosidase [Paenibacillus curdlanolyticus]EFM11373.1 glycoside hydrolase family 3 domain protein [Paenibacillus curdlanolyticus YK9]
MAEPTLSTALYRNPEAPIDDRVHDLLTRMTLQEKVRQLDQYFGTSFVSATHPHMITVMAEDATVDWDKVKSVIGEDGIGCIHDLYGTADMNNTLQRYAVEETRLGIPILFSEEALHGLLRPGMTVYPHAIAMASTWNPELVKQIGRDIAAETRSLGIHESFGPVLDLARDPRWGRVEETFGEDTHLASRMGVAMVQGLQGDSLDATDSIIAEPKHFAVHGIPESGLNHSPVSIGANDIRTYHLPVFEAAYKEGGAINAMCAYHAMDGVPCASDYDLLTGILRDEWQMPGFVRSDLGAIARLEHAHGTADSDKEAIRQALVAGVDMQYYDYPHDVYQNAIVEMVQSGELLEETLDLAVIRVLKVKFMLGLFEKPYAVPGLSERVVRSEEHLQTALQAAREAICLLQNEGSLLPLRKEIGTIAVIGPSADKARLGDYTPYIEGFQPSTVLQGIAQAVSSQTRVLHAKGTGILDGELEPIPMGSFREPNGGEGLKGEYFNNETLEGEPALVRNDPHIHFNWAITKADQQLKSYGFSVRWTGKLVPQMSFSGYIGTVTQDSMRLWLDGELLVDGWGKDKRASVSVPIELQSGREYDLRVEYVKDMNGVDITLGWSRDEEGIQEAVELARQADVAIIALGDSERTCGEGVDRSSLDLPGNQLRLLKAIHETGTPVVLVLQNGRPITLDWESQHIPAIVEVWYGGERAGEAIAEVLFGDYNPAGRLPISFPRTIGQIPVCYNKRRGGQKHYVGGDNKPLYAFGHGLSYTTFRYANLRVDKSVIAPDESVVVTMDVTNDGNVAGDEVVQLYVVDPVASVAMPEKQLRHFARIALQPGETRTVSFTVTPRDLALVNKQLAWVVELGEFTLQVGPSSDQVALEARITVA